MKNMKGKVVSIKMNNTVVVTVSGVKVHPLYKKSVTSTKKYLVDNHEELKLGDLVEFIKVRPISKMKHWKIVKKVGRDISEIVAEELKEAAAEQIAEVVPQNDQDDQAIEKVEEIVKEEEKEVVKSKKTKVKK